MRVEDIWKLLEQQKGEISSGYLYRRILPEVNYDVYVAIAQPLNIRLLMLQVSSGSLNRGIVYPSSSSFEVRRVLLEKNNTGRVALQLVLTNTKYTDIFTALTQDIVENLAPVSEEKDAVAAFLVRLKRWQAFLEQHNPDGLSETAQQGLYGELWFLRQVAIPQLGASDGTQSWTGPRRTQQDFQFERCAVEVKTTVSRQHQKLTISNERQLDDTGTGVLILLHLSLDVRQGRGETLPEMVASLRSLLEATSTANEILETLLFEAGYLDIHASRYEQHGYTIRETNYFRVERDFPRIVEADLRSGVGDVHYSIAVSECKRFGIAEPEVLSLIGNQQ